MSHSPVQKCWQNNTTVTSALHWSLISSEHLFEAWNHLLWISIRVAEPCKVCPHLQHCFAEKKPNVKRKTQNWMLNQNCKHFHIKQFVCLQNSKTKVEIHNTRRAQPSPYKGLLFRKRSFCEGIPWEKIFTKTKSKRTSPEEAWQFVRCCHSKVISSKNLKDKRKHG